MVRRLKQIDEQLTETIEAKWTLERKMIPVKVLPLRREKGKARKKPKLSTVGFSKEDYKLLLNEAKTRGYM